MELYKSKYLKEEDESTDISLCDQALKLIDEIATSYNHTTGEYKIDPSNLDELEQIIIKLKKREEAEQDKSNKGTHNPMTGYMPPN